MEEHFSAVLLKARDRSAWEKALVNLRKRNMFPVGELTSRLLGHETCHVCSLHDTERCFSPELLVERPGVAAALPALSKLPDGYSDWERSLTLHYFNNLAAAHCLYFASPVSHRQERWTVFSKACSTWQRCTAKPDWKCLLLLSFTFEVPDCFLPSARGSAHVCPWISFL